MKRVIKWAVGILCAPIVLFLVLTVLLYIPGVQRFAVNQTTEYISSHTQTQISIGSLRLSFPLDLKLNDFKMSDQENKGLLLDVQSLIVDLKLSHLLQGRVDVEGITLKEGKVDTHTLIPGVSINGYVGHFFVNAHGVDLKKSDVQINEALLQQAQVNILLNDSVSEDTTSSGPVNWVLNLDQVAIKNSGIFFSMPGDSMQVKTQLKEVILKKGVVDLGAVLYSAQSFDLQADSLRYDLPFSPATEGFDVAHLHTKDVRLKIDSVRFDGNTLALDLALRNLSLKEKSSLEIMECATNLHYDTTYIALPDFVLRTTDSKIEAAVRMDWKALDSTSVATDQFLIRLLGQIGKQDLLVLGGNLPKAFGRSYPNHPLTIRMSADGNINQIQMHTLEAQLPTAFRLKAKGEISQVAKPEKMKGKIDLDANTQNLNFIKTLAAPTDLSNINLPSLTLKGNVGINGSNYQTDLQLYEQKGSVKLAGSVDLEKMIYQAKMSIRNLNLHHFLPQDSLFLLSANADIRGRGSDLFHKSTRIQGNIRIDTLEYAKLNLGNIELKALLQNNKANLALTGATPLFQTETNMQALLTRKEVDMQLNMLLQELDWHALQASPKPLKTDFKLSVNGSSNMKDRHEVEAAITNFVISTPDSIYKTKNLVLKALAHMDTTYAYLSSGDMLIQASASEGYMSIAEKANTFLTALNEQLQRKRINQDSLRTLLPSLDCYIRSGRDNPIVNYLSSSGYYFKDMEFNLESDPEIGLNGGGYINSLNTGGIVIDTIQTHIFQDSTGVKMRGRVRNGPKNKQLVFESLVDLNIHATGAGLKLVYLDEKQEKGVDLGIIAQLQDSGTRVSLFPETPILAYRKFQLNKDNYLYLATNGRIDANINLKADDGTGIMIYSYENENADQDITLSLNHLNLKELTSVIPYAPSIAGMLQGDAHVMISDNLITASSDLTIDDMAYEGAPLGRIGMSIAYLPEEENSHYVEGIISQNNQEVATLSGSYLSSEETSRIEGKLDLLRFPLSLANGFISNQLATLEGYANGEITLAGTTSNPQIDGKLLLDSMYIKSKEYSLNLSMPKDSILLKDNLIQFNQMKLYGNNQNPLVIQGNINMKQMDNIRLDLGLTARNFELINAEKTKDASAYGRVNVDLNTTIKGDMNNLSMRGQLNVLGTTDVTYVLKDSPLTVEDRLSDLVTFTDFSDTTEQVKVVRPQPMNIDMIMVLNIDQAAQVHCLLSPDRSHYIDLEGGGSLSMIYSPDGDLQLTGRYEVISGEMKYSLPIIPLKTFTIKSGSYVEFTGDILNPRLNLSATERVRTSVVENDVPRTVSFDVGLSITQTLNNMGLEFTLEAPEDMNVQNELAAMSVEQRGRLAVTMLATGMYLSNNNANSFSTSNALNAYLQSEISKISGKALSTIDLSIGMENSTSASGSNQTDYSFQFAKRFWGNRISVIVGGKVSTGEDVENTGESLIDNVSIEYRLDNSATRYVKVFYDKSYESLLEGEITEMGAGLVLRRKMTRLGELFIFGKKKDKKAENAPSEKKTEQ